MKAMDLQKIADEIAELEEKVSTLNDVIADRWRKLTSGDIYCYFEGWSIQGENVVVYFTYPRSNERERDVIPAIYFIEDDEEKAVRLWKQEVQRRRGAEQQAKAEAQEEKEKAELRRLQDKYASVQ